MEKIIEVAVQIVNKYSEGYLNTSAAMKTAREAGLSEKEAASAAWVALNFLGISWKGETKSSTFSLKREDREYAAYKLSQKDWSK